MDISIVISFYNAEKWIGECLETALNQSFAGRYNVIVIDDGSSDGSLEILNETAARYKEKEVRIIQKDNTGLADSLNRGIAQSEATWIARVDADDRLRVDRLSIQYEYALRHDLVLLGSFCQQIAVDGTTISREAYPVRSEDLKNSLLKYKRFFPHSSAFFRRSEFIRCNGYNTFFKKSQDRDLWLRLSSLGEIGCVPECLIDLRFHPNQVTNRLDGSDYQQFVYGIAATVCYYVTHFGGVSPSVGDEKCWLRFLTWLAHQLDCLGYSRRRSSWNKTRQEYLGNFDAGLFKRTETLLGMEYKLQYLYEKLFGITVPSKLALRWIEQCAE
jgi:glycosyltransferase involved in cell wall biosynthesis